MYVANKWTIATVPPSFWARIADAEGNVARFQASLLGLPEPELRALIEHFRGLARDLVVQGFASFPEALQEEAVETLEEIAGWVVTQGRARYEGLLAQPERFPRRAEIRRPIFTGAAIEVYIDRFGGWRSEEP